MRQNSKTNPKYNRIIMQTYLIILIKTSLWTYKCSRYSNYTINKWINKFSSIYWSTKYYEKRRSKNKIRIKTINLIKSIHPLIIQIRSVTRTINSNSHKECNRYPYNNRMNYFNRYYKEMSIQKAYNWYLTK